MAGDERQERSGRRGAAGEERQERSGRQGVAKEERQEGEAEAAGCGAGPSQLLQGNMMGCRL